MAIMVLTNAIEELAAIDLGEFDMDDGDAWDRVFDSNPVFYSLFEADDIQETCETMEDFRDEYPDVDIIDNDEDLWAFMHPSDLAYSEA